MSQPPPEPAAEEPVVRRPPWGRALLALGLLAALAGLYFFGPGEAEILARQERLKARVEGEWPLSLAAFCVVETVVIGLSLPVGALMTLLAGFLFGRWWGTLAVAVGATVGALLAFLLSRYLFRDLIARLAESRPRLHRWLGAIDAGVRRDGAYYLLLLRLTPVLPFWLINLGMGLTPIRVGTYVWVTLVGMLPATFVYANAGASVSHIRSTKDLVSFELLASLMLLVLFPLALHRLVPRR